MYKYVVVVLLVDCLRAQSGVAIADGKNGDLGIDGKLLRLPPWADGVILAQGQLGDNVIGAGGTRSGRGSPETRSTWPRSIVSSHYSACHVVE
jgi:hypothetical protein